MLLVSETVSTLASLFEGPGSVRTPISADWAAEDPCAISSRLMSASPVDDEVAMGPSLLGASEVMAVRSTARSGRGLCLGSAAAAVITGTAGVGGIASIAGRMAEAFVAGAQDAVVDVFVGVSCAAWAVSRAQGSD